MEGNLHLKINLASLVVKRKFTFFAVFFFPYGISLSLKLSSVYSTPLP